TPELPEGSVVNVKGDKPIRELCVVDVVLRVAPLAEQNQIRLQSISERKTMGLEPSGKWLELRVQGVPREKRATVLHSQGITSAKGDPDIRAVDFLLDDDHV